MTRAIRTMLLYVLALSLFMQSSLFAQSPTLTQISPSSFNFFSYSTVAQPVPPAGYEFLLTFPEQSTGGQDELSQCRTYNDLKYNHYVWNGPGQNVTDWSGPVSGPLYRYFSTFDATSRSPSLGSWAGIATDSAWLGALGSSDGSPYNALVQAVFFHDDVCYESGPEFGFYRLLVHPGSSSEENTVYFYYTMNGNCYVVGQFGSCRSREDGSSLPVQTTSVPITIPVGTNSQGGKNWLWSAYLSTPTNWRIRVQDPYTLADAVTPINHTVETYFVSTAYAAYNFGLRGWISSTHVRQSTYGGLTDSTMNPIKLLTRAMYRILPVAVVAGSGSLFGMERLSGWCENGGRTVTIGTNTAAQRVQGSYPGCSVTVYNSGTATKAAIYSDSSGTVLANPFAANSVSGFWSFYAANGTYDVQLSGGSPSFPAPVTLAAQTLFDASSSTIIGPYTLPSSIGTGCWYDNGLGVLSNVNCGVGGGANAVQFNSSGNFGGSSNFTWNNSTNQLAIDGTPTTAAISVVDGNITSAEGFVSSYAQYNGFRSTNGGAYLRAYKSEQVAASTTGGYFQGVPLASVTYPLTVAGGSFGANDGLWWVGGTNGTATPNTAVAWNTNLYVNAAGGFLTNNTPFNSMQAPSGGAYALSFTAANYIQTGSASSTPSATLNDSFHAGALYYNTSDSCLKLYDGSTWACLGSGGGGGGGTPGGASTNVQYNAAGSFGGSGNFTWNNGSQLLTVTAANASSPGLVVGTGYIQADEGFLATAGSATAYNSIQAPGGGMYAKSFTALNYMQVGNSNGTPSLTTGDSFNEGALYYDTGTMSLQVYDGSSWSAITAGTGTPGGATTNVQYNNAGAFAGSANFTYSAAGQLLTVTALNASSAGIAVGTGFIQSDKGFLATVGTCTNYNCIQAPGGGVAGLSFTATNYTKVGSRTTDPTATTGDTINAGALYYNTADLCLKVHNGTSFSCVAGAGGTPGGSNTQVQYNDSGSFAGSANFTWNNASQLLTVTAASSSSAGIAVGTGYIQSDKGFLATAGVCTNYNCIQAPDGGVLSKANIATSYIKIGTSSGVPSAVTGDTFPALGSLYWDTSNNVARLYTNTGWSAILTGSIAVTALNSLQGSVSLLGTANQVTVSTSSPNITLSLPQSIATTSNVTFGTLTTNGAQQAVVTGTNIAFQTGNFNFQVNGNGAISGQQLNIGGSQVFDSSRNGTVNALTSTGLITTTNGNINVDSGHTFAVGGAFFGQDRTGGITFDLSGGGTCTLYFKGGLLYALSGC